MSAFKQTFCAPRTAGAWTVKISKEVKKERLSTMEILVAVFMFNKLQMLPSMEPLDHQAMGLHRHQRKERVTIYMIMGIKIQV